MRAPARQGRWPCFRAAVVAGVLAAAWTLGTGEASAAERALRGGRFVRFQGSGAGARGALLFAGDPALSAVGDPRCPSASTLRLAWSETVTQSIALPCANWRSTSRGYRYVDRAGLAAGVRRIVLSARTLLIRIAGQNGGPPAGGASFVEVTLEVGGDAYCGRFDAPVASRSTGWTVRGPSSACRLPRPSFVVVVLDDARFDGLGAMPSVQSRLLGEGAAFTNAFVPFAVCCPSRASLLTGLYALRHGTRQIAGPIGGADVFRERGADRQTLATWLHAAGYRTGLFGKYLNDYADTERDKGPDGTFYVPPGWDDWWALMSPEHYGGIHGPTYTTVDEAGGLSAHADHASDAEYSTDRSAVELRAFIAGAVGDRTPFFAWWAPVAPHADVPVFPVPADRHLGLFSGLVPWRPPPWNELDVDDKPRWVLARQAAAADFGPPPVEAAVDLFRQRQYEALLAVDEQIAILFDQLADLGIDRDTVVVLTSDNGFGWGEHQVWAAKECPYEECLRVPLVVRYPRRIAPRSIAAAALNIDVAPTLLALAGVETSERLDGESLRDWLFGDAPRGWRTDFLLEYWRAVRPARLTYQRQVADGDRIRLFHGDPRGKPRPSTVFEFDAGDGASAGAVAVSIGFDADDSFAHLDAALRAAIPQVNVVFVPGENTLVVRPRDQVEASAYFWEEADPLDHFSADQPIPDYFGIRDLDRGFTWVEYETGERELYDLTADPWQLTNRADDPSYAMERRRLEARLAEVLGEVEAR